MGLDFGNVLNDFGDDEADIDNILDLSKRRGNFPEWIFIIDDKEFNIGKHRTTNVYWAARYLAIDLKINFTLKQIRFDQPHDYNWNKYSARRANKFEQDDVEKIISELGYEIAQKRNINETQYDLFWTGHSAGRLSPLKKGIDQAEAEKKAQETALFFGKKITLFVMRRGHSETKQVCAFLPNGKKN